MSKNGRLDNLREEYENISVPNEVLKRIKIGVDKGKLENKKNRKKSFIKGFGIGIVAAVALVVALPNVSGNVAKAMDNVPIVGSLAKIVTFREYKFKSNNYNADVSMPNISGLNRKLTEDMKYVNTDINKITDEAIKKFKEGEKEKKGYGSLNIKYKIISNTNKYITLKLSVFTSSASGYEKNYFYTFNKETCNEIKLKDLFKENSDYINIISNEIKKQMINTQINDSSKTYFINDKDIENNFNSISDKVQFYINNNLELVIAFDEYEVAPGSMGTPEFIIPNDVIKEIRIK